MLTEQQKVKAAIKGIVRRGDKLGPVRRWGRYARILPKLNKSQRKQIVNKKKRLAQAVLKFTVRIN